MKFTPKILPLLLTVIVGGALAGLLGFTGIVWWAWMILFYFVILAVLGKAGG